MPLAVATLLAVCPNPMTAQDRVVGRSFASRTEVWARNGMAATSHPLATQTALDILKAGGNAVDAAIAANAMLCLCEPTGCGIGGDLFAMVWDGATETLHGINGSGRSPAKLTLKWFVEHGHTKIPAHGPLPVTVPGCVDAWFKLHDKFGKLPMKSVLAPTIAYAQAGVPVPETIAHYWGKGAAVLKDFPGFKEVFLPWGRPPKVGDIFKNPALARTLRTIAESGRDAFYSGRIAEEIVAFLQKHGGHLSREDLATHASEWVVPVSTSYRGYRVFELPPNGQGIAVLQLLNLIEPYDVKAMGFGSAAWVHLFVEAKKLVFEDRARFYADPAFEKLPVDQLISKPYAAKRGKLIDLNVANKAVKAGAPRAEKGDTIYLTVADRDGTMVSLIQSNYRGMGSGMTPPTLGFCLQDRGELFDLSPGRGNSFAPSKRPFHTIIPAFVTREGQPWLSFGVMGGAMQPQGHVQVLVNMIDFGMNLQEAGDAPRIRHEGSSQPTGEVMVGGGKVWLESGYGAAVVDALRKKGHVVGLRAGGFGGYQAIRRDAKRGVYAGASESRKDGHAAGY